MSLFGLQAKVIIERFHHWKSQGGDLEAGTETTMEEECLQAFSSFPNYFSNTTHGPEVTLLGHHSLIINQQYEYASLVCLFDSLKKVIP